MRVQFINEAWRFDAKARHEHRNALRRQLDDLIQAKRHGEALRVVLALARLEPHEPRWPRRYGDLMRVIGRLPTAARAYSAAAHRYAKQGFTLRADAMNRLAEQVRDAASRSAASRTRKEERP